MTDKNSTTAWDKTDKRWREVSYLDYLADKPADEQEQALRQVMRWSWEGTIFAPISRNHLPSLPAAGRTLSFKSCSMTTGKSNYSANSWKWRWRSGHKVRLALARPWYAYFDEREGDFPLLPHNWTEVLHAHKDGFGGNYEWIGRQHSWLEFIVHWEPTKNYRAAFGSSRGHCRS